MVKLRKKLTEFCVLVVIIMMAAYLYVNVGAALKERADSIQERIDAQYEYIDFTEGVPLGAP